MHHKFTVIVLGVISAVLLGACPVDGALVAYMKVGEIRGDASAEGHEEWSEILSYDMSVQNSGWHPEEPATNVSLSDMYVTKYTDRASPYLLNAAWTGEHFDEAWIDVVKEDAMRDIYLQWRFQDVVVSGYSTVLDGNSAELVALDFRKVTYKYFPAESAPIQVIYDRQGTPPGIVGSIPAGLELMLSFPAQPTPEPTTWFLLGSATLGLAMTRGRRP